MEWERRNKGKSSAMRGISPNNRVNIFIWQSSGKEILVIVSRFFFCLEFLLAFSCAHHRWQPMLSLYSLSCCCVMLLFHLGNLFTSGKTKHRHNNKKNEISDPIQKMIFREESLECRRRDSQMIAKNFSYLIQLTSNEKRNWMKINLAISSSICWKWCW